MGKPLTEPPWLKHYQQVWLDRSTNTRTFEDWFRVMSLAFGTVRQNGHACFLPGEMAGILELTPDALSKAIRRAKEKGVISPDSNARCLVVPPHAVAGGLGNQYEYCAVHHGKRTGARITKPRAKQRNPKSPVESEVRDTLTTARTDWSIPGELASETERVTPN